MTYPVLPPPALPVSDAASPEAAAQAEARTEAQAQTQSQAEAELAARIRDGDEAAFEALFRAHYAGLCAAGFRLLGSRPDAEEVVQEVLRRVWERRGHGEIRESLERYCYRAVRNEALNRLRRRCRETAWHQRAALATADAGADGAAPTGAAARPRSADQCLEDEEMLAAVARAVETLPDRCRLVFELKWRRGLRYAEIAETLGIAEKTVENQLLKAIKAIRLSLGELLEP